MEESSSSQSAETAETETIVITPSELEKLGLEIELKKITEKQSNNKSPPIALTTTDSEPNTEEASTDVKESEETLETAEIFEEEIEEKDEEIFEEETEEIFEEQTDDDDLEIKISEVKDADDTSQNTDADTVSSVEGEEYIEEFSAEREKAKKTYKNETRSTTLGGRDKASRDAKTSQMTYKAESSNISVKSEDDSQEAVIDPKVLQKTMKSKLCTLLNHTPLVMQVKNVNWITQERKSPILLNSGVRTSLQTNDENSESKPKLKTSLKTNDEDNESKPKLKIVSDEKSNLSPSEIECMINSGKQIKTDEKITTAQKQTDESNKHTQSTSKDNTDPVVLKKECLKRIQAKMYENLKKVLEEVDSFPVKDKASLHIKPVQSSTPDETKTYKQVPAAKPPEKVKEHKPCYMSTYRERKRSQESSEDSRTPKSVSDGEVIEIDSQPGSPTNVSKQITKARIISLTPKGAISVGDDDVVKVRKKRGRPPKRLSNADKLSDEDYKVGKDIETANRPLKKTIAKRYSESVKNDSPTVTASGEQKIPKKRGRPRKNFGISTPKNNDCEVDQSLPHSNNTTEISSKDITDVESKEKPETTPRRRGRPPKNAPQKTESKTEDKVTSEQPTISESKKDEIKTPKKRGRKSKAELEALRMKEAEELEKVEVEERQNYTQSKTSGRKRKIVNYSLLNGEDSDSDEPDMKVNRAESSVEETSENEEDDKSSQVEYGSSKKSYKRRRTEDDEDEEFPKSKESKQTEEEDEGENDDKDDALVDHSDEKDDRKAEDTTDNKNNNINENHKVKGDPIEHAREDLKSNTETMDAVETEQSDEKGKSCEDGAADVMQCGVCDVKIQKSLWPEHKRKVHNDLTWTSDEKPLVVQVETLQ